MFISSPMALVLPLLRPQSCWLVCHLLLLVRTTSADNIDHLECFRELLRSILTICGLWQGTDIAKEWWLCLTITMYFYDHAHEISAVQAWPENSAPWTTHIDSAAPGRTARPLWCLNATSRRSILLQEASSCRAYLAEISMFLDPEEPELATFLADTSIWLEDIEKWLSR